MNYAGVQVSLNDACGWLVSANQSDCGRRVNGNVGMNILHPKYFLMTGSVAAICLLTGSSATAQLQSSTNVSARLYLRAAWTELPPLAKGSSLNKSSGRRQDQSPI